LGRSTERRWYLPVGLLASAIFFSALYHDTGRQARIEAEMEKIVQALPAGERVVSYADLPNVEEHPKLSTREQKLAHFASRLSVILIVRLNETHLLSRACLGHCFDYMNYEPSTDQFRIHALPENPIALANWGDVTSMMNRSYMIKPRELPLYALLRCGPGVDGLLIRPMAGGEIGTMLACPATPSHSP